MLRINNTCEIHQNKSNLERTPSEIAAFTLLPDEVGKATYNFISSMLFSIVFDAVLQENHTVHKTERFKGSIVCFNDVNTLADPPQRILTATNHGIPDSFPESLIFHPLAARKRFSDPAVIGISQCFQFTYRFVLFGLLGHSQRGEIILVKTVKCCAHPRKFILRNKRGTDRSCFAINRLIPYRRTATPTPQDGTLRKIEFVCGENLPTNMLRYENRPPIFRMGF